MQTPPQPSASTLRDKPSQDTSTTGEKWLVYASLVPGALLTIASVMGYLSLLGHLTDLTRGLEANKAQNVAIVSIVFESASALVLTILVTLGVSCMAIAQARRSRRWAWGTAIGAAILAPVLWVLAKIESEQLVAGAPFEYVLVPDPVGWIAVVVMLLATFANALYLSVPKNERNS